MQNPFAVFLMGPTGCGKTQLSLSLCQHLPCEIISVDSALVYKNMDIGTAKPSLEERQQVPHHLIDIIDPSARYSAGLFVQAVAPLIHSICQADRIPVLTGGTMFYFHALEHGLDDMPAVEQVVYDEIEVLERKHGLAFLYQELKQADPEIAGHIHPNDAQRIKRSLGVYRSGKKPLSSLQTGERHSGHDIQFLKVGLLASDRSLLHRRVEDRFDKMLGLGLLEEVVALMLRGDLHRQLPAIRAVGYAQVWSYLIGEYGYDEMRLRAIYATRQLIKRQLTWMRGMKNIHEYYIDIQSLSSITDALRTKITKFGTMINSA